MTGGKRTGRTLTVKQFVQELSEPRPVYVVLTEQVYLQQRILEVCREQVDEAAREFDWAFHDLSGEKGRRAADEVRQEVNRVLETLRMFPWCGVRRWVYVRNAHLGEKFFSSYVASPVQHSVLVLETPQKIPAWSSLPTVTESIEGREAQWLQSKARKEGFQLEREAAEVMVDRVGNDLQSLTAELEKLMLFCWERRRITPEDVLEVIANVRERDVFELIAAIAENDRAKVLRLLNRLFDSGLQAPQLIGLLYWNFKRLLALRERLEAGDRFEDALAELKLWSFKGRKGTVLEYSRSRLRELVLRLREADGLAKSGGPAIQAHLERLLIDRQGGMSV